MSAPNVARRVPQFTALWLTLLCLALFQLGLVAGQGAAALDAGKPITGAVVRAAVWALLGACALRLLLPGLRRPVIAEPDA